MKRFFARVLPRVGHLSDETISLLVSGELHSVRESRAQAHLANCWQCRGRRDAFEKAALQVVEYRKARLEAELPLAPNRRDAFLAQLDRMLGRSAPPSSWPRMLARIRMLRFPDMNPIYASAFVVCVAVLTLFWIWQRSAPPIAASALLEKAVAQERAGQPGQQQPGVIYQEVRIQEVGTGTAHRTIVRQLYRDRQGRRKMRPEKISAEAGPVRATLLHAGVAWDDPLSATSYKDWHDRQPVFTDHVADSGGNLLTLTTSLPQGDIASESLTLREDDFHPVQRTVAMRDQGTIEIAELNYAVLDWNAVNGSLFESSVAALPHIAPAHPAFHAALLHAPPTSLEIDAAELEARIALNHIGADTQDQIAVSHSDTGVVVKGIVPTVQRKWQLMSSLGHIPYVHPDILSTEELSARRGSGPLPPAGTSGSQTYSTDQPSPLASYIQEKKLSQDELNQISQSLLDACLSAQQGAARIAELQDRFSAPEQLDPQARANLQGLIATYSRSITGGLDAEIAAMKQIGIAPLSAGAAQSDGAPSGAASLGQYVHQNQSLCQELIAASSGTPRSAAAIAADLQRSINRIQAALAAMQTQSR